MGTSAAVPTAEPVNNTRASPSSAILRPPGVPSKRAASGPSSLPTIVRPKGISVAATSRPAPGTAAANARPRPISRGSPRSICSSAWRSMLAPKSCAKDGATAPATPPAITPLGPNLAPAIAPALAEPSVAAIWGTCSATALGTWLRTSPAAGSKPRSR